MPELYPLLLKPEFRERIWGTRDLSPIYAEVPGTEPVGEVWLTGDDCRVANGALAGTTLGELSRRYGRELVGETAREARRFPLLIKFLFPREKLSVQVHPDDDAARRLGQPCGKTECWYVLQAEPGAQVGLGLKPGTTREQFGEAIRNLNAEQSLNWINIQRGDLVYVEAGTVHAIGPGSILVETQQNSDTTYRLYDYGRARELHVADGLAALKEQTRAGKVAPQGDPNAAILVASSCFVVERHRWTNPQRSGNGFHFASLHDPEGSSRSVEVLVGLAGCGVVEAEPSPPIVFGRGDVVVIPACVDDFRLRAQWELDILVMGVPPAERGETC